MYFVLFFRKNSNKVLGIKFRHAIFSTLRRLHDKPRDSFPGPPGWLVIAGNKSPRHNKFEKQEDKLSVRIILPFYLSILLCF